MRTLLLCAVLLTTAACTTTRVVTPREYLDENTAATITVVAEPWIFNRDGAPAQLDFVHLYAIDVNRMGDHRKYLALVHYWPEPALVGRAGPSLVVNMERGTIDLSPSERTARDIGIGQPLDSGMPRSARAWYYELSRTQLQAMASTAKLALTLIADGKQTPYIVWRDGSAELNEFVAVAQDW